MLICPSCNLFLFVCLSCSLGGGEEPQEAILMMERVEVEKRDMGDGSLVVASSRNHPPTAPETSQAWLTTSPVHSPLTRHHRWHLSIHVSILLKGRGSFLQGEAISFSAYMAQYLGHYI